MFDDYRHRLGVSTPTLNDAIKKNSQSILDHNFDTSTNYCKVLINNQEYEARIISDSKTTIRSGAGNYVIHFKNNLRFNSGTYVDIPHHDKYIRWMLMYEDDDPFFDKPIIKKCNYHLKWKNDYGEIIERDVVFNDNIRLNPNVMEAQRGKAVLPMHSKIVVLPLDIETMNIQRDDRFLIDLDFGLRHEPSAYVVVNRNITSKVNNAKNFDGVVELSLTEHQFNPKTDNAELMIADYYEESIKQEVEEISSINEKRAVIKYQGKNNLVMGMNYKEYVAEFYSDGKLENSIIPQWEVILNNEYKDYFDYKIENNKLYIKCSYSPLLINSHCKIILYSEDKTYQTEESIKVVSAI